MSKGRREESDGIADTERLSSQFSAVHSAEALESTDEEMEALEHALLMRSWRILGSFIEAEATPSVVIEAQLSLFFYMFFSSVQVSLCVFVGMNAS